MAGFITHKKYMENSSKYHHEYYLQFSNISNVLREQFRKIYYLRYSTQKWFEKLSKDKNLNSLWSGWSTYLDKKAYEYRHEVARVNKIINNVDTWSHSSFTCATSTKWQCLYIISLLFQEMCR
jgi:hypothetical protein